MNAGFYEFTMEFCWHLIFSWTSQPTKSRGQTAILIHILPVWSDITKSRPKWSRKYRG